MPLPVLIPFAAAIFSLLLAVVAVFRKKPSPATWCFFAGMVALGADSICIGLALCATQPEQIVHWQTWGFIVKTIVPGIWLGFSLTYSRGNYREFLARWKLPLAIVGLLPLALALAFQGQLLSVAPVGEAHPASWLRFGTVARFLNIILLVAPVLILMNLEQTFRSAIGTMRWRIKFVVLALAVIFGARLYVWSQSVLFSRNDLALSGVESGALLIGCVLLAVAYLRTGFAEIDVYPSLEVLRTSLTVVFVGGYLFVVGVLAQMVRYIGGADSFQFQAFLVLVGMAGLAVLLLSDRLRQKIHHFVVRHFRKAQHDSVRIWTLFSRRLANVKDQADLCAASARSIAETFEVLSVSIWLLDEAKDQLLLGASTASAPRGAVGDRGPDAASDAVAGGLRGMSASFDLETLNAPWAEEMRQLNPAAFSNGGHRFCVPLRAGEKCLGAIVLADRISGASYTFEEFELLKCIGDQVTSVLLNLRLAHELVQAREMEAFRTMSAFFVHDLKNAASALNLMLKNLPVHFDDPAFRADALRGIGNTASRIEEMIARLSALRQRPDFKPVDSDLNQLAGEALDRIGEMPGVELVRDLPPLPALLADREQIQSVVTNLVLNARDALSGKGRIEVRTGHGDGRVVLTVADNGCGMSAAFLRDSLFRPFQSTKKKGLGIGMFQSRMIVEAHQGSIQVESDARQGTTFRVSFPIKDAK